MTRKLKADDLEAKGGVRRTGRGQHPRLRCPGTQVRPACAGGAWGAARRRARSSGEGPAEDPAGLWPTPHWAEPPLQTVRMRVLFELGTRVIIEIEQRSWCQYIGAQYVKYFASLVAQQWRIRLQSKRHKSFEWKRSPGGRHDNPLQYFYLDNFMDRGAWQAIVHRVAKSQTPLKWLSSSSVWNITYIYLWYEHTSYEHYYACITLYYINYLIYKYSIS